jgi:hypothetical protein
MGNWQCNSCTCHNSTRQPCDPAAVTSKPRNPPRPDAAELARGKAAAQAAPTPGAGHDVTRCFASDLIVSRRLSKAGVVPRKIHAFFASRSTKWGVGRRSKSKTAPHAVLRGSRGPIYRKRP